ncbi:cyclic nucleotide-binding domain-containing protein 2-like isoform X2 [Watersipora subatra]
MVLACLIWSRRSIGRMESEHRSVLSFMHTDSASRNLLFDAMLYKANKEIGVHQELKRILSLAPSRKSSRDIHLALLALREIPSFAEYPTPMQIEMCRVGWYQRVESKRVIVKEGQEAFNFYFILSGTVVITEWNELMKCSETKCILQRGMNFGEQALLQRGHRSATVVSHVTTELLCLDAQELSTKYISHMEMPIKDKTIHNFLRDSYFLKDFPLDFISRQPHVLVFHYFQKGQILVRNSHHSDWLYIVKSGSLSVLKKLESCKAEAGKPFDKSCELPKICSMNTKVADNKHNLVNLHNLRNQKFLSKSIDEEMRRRHQAKPPYMYRTTSRKLSAFAQNTSGHLPPLVEDRLSIGARLDFLQSHAAFNDGAEVSKPTFIKVCKLEKGQTFGLVSEVFGDQPSLALVSDGADCLLLSKQFFFKHCSNRTLTYIHERELPYPTDEELQHKLQSYVNWIKFKDDYYQEIVQMKARLE